MIKLREEVQWFAELMELKLRVNEHKGHWAGCEDYYLKKRLDEEVFELKIAEGDDVIGEAADVGNFAMMIADNYRRKAGA